MHKYTILLLSLLTFAAALHAAPPELHVSGNKVLDSEGHEVWLQGINTPSLSWTFEGDRLLETTDAILSWKANLVRLPLNQSMWYGKAKGQTDGGALYRALVDKVVQKCSDANAYCILDLHWSNTGKWEVNANQYNMPDPLSEVFWKDVATLYANNPAVLYDLYNEPKDVSWDVWKNGGDIVEGPKKEFSYHTCGMQALIELVRKTGAKNIVICGGLDWAYDLRGVLNGYELHDPSGNGIMYASHIYEWKTKWQACVLDIAAKHPVILGEVGADPRHMEVHKTDGPEEWYTWVPDMFGLIQKHKLHWAAWSMHTDATPRIISDWNFTPTPFWGAFVRAALSGAQFECNRLR